MPFLAKHRSRAKVACPRALKGHFEDKEMIYFYSKCSKKSFRYLLKKKLKKKIWKNFLKKILIFLSIKIQNFWFFPSLFINLKWYLMPICAHGHAHYPNIGPGHNGHCPFSQKIGPGQNGHCKCPMILQTGGQKRARACPLPSLLWRRWSPIHCVSFKKNNPK